MHPTSVLSPVLHGHQMVASFSYVFHRKFISEHHSLTTFGQTGGQDDLLTIFSPWEQRVVARCQGHSSFVSAVAFDELRCDGRTYRFGSVGEDNKLILVRFSYKSLSGILLLTTVGLFFRRPSPPQALRSTPPAHIYVFLPFSNLSTWRRVNDPTVCDTLSSCAIKERGLDCTACIGRLSCLPSLLSPSHTADSSCVTGKTT